VRVSGLAAILLAAHGGPAKHVPPFAYGSNPPACRVWLQRADPSDNRAGVGIWRRRMLPES